MAPGCRKCWSEDSVRRAVEAVRNKEMEFLKASKLFNVPRSTLEKYVDNKTKDLDTTLKRKIGRKCALGDELENELASYCKVMDERFFGLQVKDIRVLAYQLALKNNLQHPFHSETGMAGKKWLRNFMKRHPQLCYRTPRSVSISRAKGFTKENVDAFFDLLKPELEKINFNSSRIYNVDETGMTIVQGSRSKVISIKGKKEVSKLSSAERGKLITAVTCMSASGNFIPPFLVFPRKNMKAELFNGTPPGTIAACHPSGWIQLHIFTDWFRHFIQHAHSTIDDPIVLILDGHYSHPETWT